MQFRFLFERKAPRLLTIECHSYEARIHNKGRFYLQYDLIVYCSMWRTASGWNDRSGHIWGVVVLSLALATAASSLHIQDYSEMEDMYERPQR